MAKNIRKNVKKVICPVCEQFHILDQDSVTNTAFECEKCGNDLYIDSLGKIYAFANPEKAKTDKEIAANIDPKPTEKISVETQNISKPEPQPEPPKPPAGHWEIVKPPIEDDNEYML